MVEHTPEHGRSGRSGLLLYLSDKEEDVRMRQDSSGCVPRRTHSPGNTTSWRDSERTDSPSWCRRSPESRHTSQPLSRSHALPSPTPVYLLQVVVQALDEQTTGLQVAVSRNGDDPQRRRCKRDHIESGAFLHRPLSDRSVQTPL